QPSRLKVMVPLKDSTVIADTPAYFRGIADPLGDLFLNGIEVPVYSTGVFAAPLQLQEGINEVQVWHVLGADTLRKRMVVVSGKPVPPKPTDGFSRGSDRVLPGGDLWLEPGEPLQVEMKATPGMDAPFYNDIPLFEVDTAKAGVAGIYRGEYIIKSTDSLTALPISFYLRDP